MGVSSLFYVRAFRLLAGLAVIFRVVSSCERLESGQGILGADGVCQNDLSNLGVLNRNLLQQTPNATKLSSSVISPNHEVRSSPGKGLGLFATRRIPRGTLILLESPLISISTPELVDGHGFRIADMLSDLSTAFSSLTLSQQEDIMSLHNFRYEAEHEENENLMTIFRSNAYNTGEDRVGLFPKTARINHSCRPNAGGWWSEKRERKIAFAMRDIEMGEEITVSYIPLLKTTNERQARLKQYGFVCDCDACADDGGGGDRTRVRIGEWLEDLEGKVGRKSQKLEVSRKRAEKARKLVDMIEGEGLGDYLARAYHLAAVFLEHADDLAEAVVWAEKEQELLAWVEKDSEETLASARYLDRLKNG